PILGRTLVVDDVNKFLALVATERTLRNQDRFVRFANRHAEPYEQTGRQEPVLVRKLGADPQGSRAGIDAVVAEIERPLVREILFVRQPDKDRERRQPRRV